jgi:hypothetical protein
MPGQRNKSRPESASSKLVVIELNKEDSKPLGTQKELHAAILGLQSHLGFEELLRRMRLARALLRARLEQDTEDANRHAIRGLIQAYGFLERQLKQEVGRPTEVERGAYEEERQEYERLAQFVEFVGRTSTENAN